MTIYIAYGSNLNKTQMKTRCPSAKVVGSTTLPGYSLAFRRSVATIIHDPRGKCPVGLWELGDDDFESMDGYEGHHGHPGFDSYHKYSMRVNLPGGGTAIGIIYTINPVENNNIVEPRNGYLETIAKGYDDFHLDKQYLRDVLIRDFGHRLGAKYAKRLETPVIAPKNPIDPAIEPQPGEPT